MRGGCARVTSLLPLPFLATCLRGGQDPAVRAGLPRRVPGAWVPELLALLRVPCRLLPLHCAGSAVPVAGCGSLGRESISATHYLLPADKVSSMSLLTRKHERGKKGLLSYENILKILEVLNSSSSFCCQMKERASVTTENLERC